MIATETLNFWLGWRKWPSFILVVLYIHSDANIDIIYDISPLSLRLFVLTILDISLLSSNLMWASLLSTWPYITREDKRFLPPKDRKALEAKIKTISDKLGINKPIRLIESEYIPYLPFKTIAYARGINILPLPAGIVVNTKRYNNVINDNEIDWILAHELAHIKNSDALFCMLIAIGTTLLFSFFASLLMPITGDFFSNSAHFAFMFGTVCSFISVVLYSRWSELRADRDGFLACSREAQQRGVQFFKQKITEVKANRNADCGNRHLTRLNKLTISESGNDRLDFVHPSLNTRLKQFEGLVKKDSETDEEIGTASTYSV